MRRREGVFEVLCRAVRGHAVERDPVQPVKIVRILGRMNIGGPAVHAVLLTHELSNKEFQSILVTGTIGRSEGDMLYLAARRGVKPVVIPELGREISLVDDVVALWKLCRFLARERPDIVHTHTAKAGTLGRIAALLARVRIRIHTFHGHVFHGYFGPVTTRLFIAIEQMLACFTTRIVAISQGQLADLSNRYRIASRNKFRVIPIGLDLDPLLRIPEGQTERGALNHDRDVVIGFVGRLVPIKNPDLALQVFERLIRGHPGGDRYRLIVAGDGELRPVLERRAEQAGIGPQVVFAGWQDDLSRLYPRVDLVLLTSINEGTPVALIEAMAAARPFVAARVGGVADLMVGAEHVVRGSGGRPLFSLFANGALAFPGDVEGLTAAVEHLLAHPAQMADMGLAGRRFVKERFSRQRLVADTIALYRECLEEQASPGVQAGRRPSLAGRPSSGRKVGA